MIFWFYFWNWSRPACSSLLEGLSGREEWWMGSHSYFPSFFGSVAKRFFWPFCRCCCKGYLIPRRLSLFKTGCSLMTSHSMRRVGRMVLWQQYIVAITHYVSYVVQKPYQFVCVTFSMSLLTKLDALCCWLNSIFDHKIIETCLTFTPKKGANFCIDWF